MNAATRIAMVATLGLFGTTLVASGASAQIDLSGRYRCVALCAAGLQGQPAFVTQNGWNLNLLNEAGEPSRAWIDWSGHLWADNWQEGALYTTDGMTIQFDRGTIWQRDLGELVPPPPPVIVVPGKHKAPKKRVGEYEPEEEVAPHPAPVRPAPVRPAPAVSTAYDGDWSVLILTQDGPCDHSYRYGVRIANGNVYYDGAGSGSVDVQGHVYSSGAVRVSVEGLGQHADGEGHLSRSAGNGTWQGGGSLGSCAGVWQAERRG